MAAVRDIPGTEFTPDVLPPGGPVAVMFTADWCGWCNLVLPFFERRAKDAPRDFLRVDLTDRQDPLWEELAIHEVPTVAVFRGEACLAAVQGVKDGHRVDQLLSTFGL